MVLEQDLQITKVLKNYRIQIQIREIKLNQLYARNSCKTFVIYDVIFPHQL